jgi:hypothetical protein
MITVMDIMEILANKDAEITRTASEVNQAEVVASVANQSLAEKRTHLEKLRHQRETLAEVAQQYGVVEENPATTLEAMDVAAEEIAEWRSLTRLDAVERVLREATGPRHITEIDMDLKAHGRPDETYALVSASLANLRRRRGTVVPLGHGRWEFNRAGTNTGRNPVMEQMAQDVGDRLAHGMEPVMTEIQKVLTAGLPTDYGKQAGEAIQHALEQGDASG